MKYISYYESPLGGITLGSDGRVLTGLWFERQKYFGTGLDNEYEEKELPVFEETKRWLDIYFDGKVPDFTPELGMNCSDFRKEVWEIMLSIPYGKTMTYGEIAEMIAQRQGKSRVSAQAVGGAVGHNAIGLIIPCHRVIGADGSLTGYAGGLDKKKWLLEHEGAEFKAENVTGNVSFSETVTKLLIKSDRTISFMESCTSGLLASMFTDTEGASSVFTGSFVTYANEIKIRNGVSPDIISEYGVYSKECAADMARAVQKAFGSDIAVGITGNTGNKDPENPEGITGEAFYCIRIGNESHDFKIKVNAGKMSRKDIKQYYADRVYESLYRLLQR